MNNIGGIQGIQGSGGNKYKKGKDAPKRPNKNQGNNDANSSNKLMTANVRVPEPVSKAEKEQKNDDNTIQRQKKEPNAVKVMGIEDIDIAVNPETHKIATLVAHNVVSFDTNDIANKSNAVLEAIKELDLETIIATAVEIKDDKGRTQALNQIFLENITDIAKSVNS